MTYETMNKMWNILTENEFYIDVKIKLEVACISCKNIMIKPCNVPCGCRYCFDCLKTYLNDEEKLCLGESDYCRSELINIDNNVFFDQVANVKISRIVVKCPFESCEFFGKLGNMADHMRTCDRQPDICPYDTIGCEKNKIGFDQVDRHFKEENLSHTRLLMDFVENWRNEMKLLKTSMLDLQEENRFIKKEMESKQDTILALEKNVTKLLQKIGTPKEFETQKCHENKQTDEIILAMQMKSKEQSEEIEKHEKKLNEIEITQERTRCRIERITQENTSLREELEIMKLDNKAKEKTISGLQTNSEKEEQDIEKIHQEIMKRRIEELFLETKNLKDELETVKQKMIREEAILLSQKDLEKQEQGINRNTEKIENLKQEFIKAKTDETSNENAETTIKSKKSGNPIRTCETELTESHTNQNCGEYLWCISNWKEKKERAQNGIETEIYSDPFFSHKNGYKMCLRLCPYGNGTGKETHLSLFICIMPGEFDHILQWPFQHGFKLELLNQRTGENHDSGILRADECPSATCWKRPWSKINDGIGFPEFIELSELSSNAALCHGDQILIRVTTQIKP